MSNWLLYNVPGLTAEENLIKTGSGSNASSTLKNIFLVGTDGKLNPNATLMYNDDWEDAVFQKSFRQEYNVTVRPTKPTISFQPATCPIPLISFRLNSTAITCVPMSIRRLING